MSAATAPWSASWVAAEPRRGPDAPSETLTGSAGTGRFARTLFRTTVELTQIPAAAPTRVSADSRYVLWVNGHEVGRGPARAQPYRQRYDEHDLAPFLVVGENVVAVLVTYYGRATSFWQPAPAGSSPDASLVLEADLGDRLLLSDETWRVARPDAWALLAGHNGGEGVPVEICDARRVPQGWQQPGFDDQGWAAVSLVRATHPAGLGRTTPPTYPFGRLRPRGISPLGGELVSPVQVLDSSTRAVEVWDDEHPVSRVVQTLLVPAQADGPTQLPAELTVAPGRVHHLSFDFGRIVAGFVELDLEAAPGAVVELHYREKRFRPELAALREDPATGARYTTAGPRDAFRALELNGLRFLHLVVHSETPATVRVQGVRVREHLYPRTGGAYFRSDDPGLDALYRAGIRTVQLNSLDSYTDCPTREQRAWVGDAVVHQMVDLATNEDWGLARNYLELSDSPRPDGILPMVVASDVEAAGGLTIPDWSLSWIHGLHEQYWHDGDLDALRRHLPTAEQVLRWFGQHLDERGTLADVPEWSLVDWASIFVSGRSSILTALWARALTEFAELSDAVGNAGSAGWARSLHAAAVDGFEDFWDAGRGLYVDHVLDGEQQPAASQVAQASAILSGLVPTARWAPLADAMTDPERLVVRSWVGSETGGYDQERFAEQMRGVQRADWDVHSEMVIAEPFFSYAVHDAVARAGRAELLPGLLRRWDVFLTDGYDTFGECWGWGTPVHGWSSTPTRDLVRYVLGVRPGAPGWTSAQIAPLPGGLRRLEGSVPTPYGLLEVRVADGVVEVTSPVPATVVAPDGTETEVPAGTHRVPLR